MQKLFLHNDTEANFIIRISPIIKSPKNRTWSAFFVETENTKKIAVHRFGPHLANVAKFTTRVRERNQRHRLNGVAAQFGHYSIEKAQHFYIDSSRTISAASAELGQRCVMV